MATTWKDLDYSKITMIDIEGWKGKAEGERGFGGIRVQFETFKGTRIILQDARLREALRRMSPAQYRLFREKVERVVDHGTSLMVFDLDTTSPVSETDPEPIDITKLRNQLRHQINTAPDRLAEAGKLITMLTNLVIDAERKE